MPKERLDVLMVQRGLAESREQAQRLILAGDVRSDGQVVCKPGHSFDTECELDVRKPPRFVGRGGDKLEAAFESFDIHVDGLVCLDIGASTGGFTDCLLQHGAARVIAVDVGKGQLHWKLRNDPRVVVMENVNARYLDLDDLQEQPHFSVADVSFISLTMILPALTRVLGPAVDVVTLIKPQFEAGRHQVGRGGVVRDPEVHRAVVEGIRSFGENKLGWRWLALRESPLRGPAGNIEYLAHWQTPARTPDGEMEITA